MLDPLDEFDENDVTPQLGDPERDLPKVPSVDVDESDVDPDVRGTFWWSVFLANMALFGLTIGPMVAYFRGRWVVGGVAVALGVVMVVRVYQHYRAFDQRHDD